MSDSTASGTAAMIQSVDEMGNFQKVLLKITFFLLCVSAVLVVIAMGYLIADALGRPLLAPLDARPVGKRIDTRAGAVEKQLAAMPRAAAEAARKAGAAAKKMGGPFDAKQHAAEHEAWARAKELAKEYERECEQRVAEPRH